MRAEAEADRRLSGGGGGGGYAKLYVEWIDGSEASFVVVAAFWSDLCIAREECDM